MLDALGMSSSDPGHELIGRLERPTGTTAPAPLAGLAGKAERFTGCVEPEEMRAAVVDFLA